MAWAQAAVCSVGSGAFPLPSSLCWRSSSSVTVTAVRRLLASHVNNNGCSHVTMSHVTRHTSHVMLRSNLLHTLKVGPQGQQKLTTEKTVFFMKTQCFLFRWGRLSPTRSSLETRVVWFGLQEAVLAGRVGRVGPAEAAKNDSFTTSFWFCRI